ncbi:MAG: 6-phosphogluconolactonase [Actinomycetes bacterium]
MEHFTEIRRAVNSADVAQQASREIIETLVEAIAKNGVANVALTGGTVGILTLATLAEQPDLELINLSKVHFWWGDERFVESTSTERNAVQARQALFEKISVSETHIHEFPAIDQVADLKAGKDKFVQEIAAHFGQLVPIFDLVILGMGPDGHIASLFPGHESLADDQVIVAEPNSPKPPAHRLSLSYSAINAAAKIVFVVSGLDKADAVTQIHSNVDCELPAAKINAIGETIWFVDQAAGADFWSC